MNRRGFLASLLGAAVAPALEPFKGTAFSFLGNILRKPPAVKTNGDIWMVAYGASGVLTLCQPYIVVTHPEPVLSLTPGSVNVVGYTTTVDWEIPRS